MKNKKIIYIMYILTLCVCGTYIWYAQDAGIIPAPQPEQMHINWEETINPWGWDFQIDQKNKDNFYKRWFDKKMDWSKDFMKWPKPKWVIQKIYEKVFWEENKFDKNEDFPKWPKNINLKNEDNDNNIKQEFDKENTWWYKKNSTAQTWIKDKQKIFDDNKEKKGLILPPPPPKWFIFRFMWPKKDNIQKTISQLEKLTPKLESKWIDTKSIKEDIYTMKINHQVADSLMLLWMMTPDKEGKKKLWDKMFALHTTDMEKLKSIKIYISSKLWKSNNLSGTSTQTWNK